MTLAPPRPSTAAQAAPALSPRTARCTVGLVTWNGGEDVLACVRALLAQTEAPLVIRWIDNASTDGTVERVRAAFPAMPEPLVHARNEGFCAPHNALLAACRTPYYLALNQDAVLAPDYIARLCDWLDEAPELALVSGLILMPTGAGEPPRVYSAGMAWPKVRFAFELGMGGPVRPEFEGRRSVPAVDGSAMMLRVEACRGASLPERDVFPETFFAYSEEVDLAVRLARCGWGCGVDGAARAIHGGQGSGGLARPSIRARFFCNHWLLTLRHDPWATILRELPWIVWGELRYWVPQYVKYPRAFVLALRRAPSQGRAARRFYRASEAAWGPSRAPLAELRRRSRQALRALRSEAT